MKILEAKVATSQYVSRKQILFDEESGLILDVIDPIHQRIDYYYSDDCVLFAGFGDVHIHARDDVSEKNCYKEDFQSAMAAMRNGGVTHAGDMPNNPIPPVDDVSYRNKWNHYFSKKTNGCLWFYAGIGPQTKPLSIKVPYKAYMGPSIGELFFKNNKDLDEALIHYVGENVSFHCEDPEILDHCKNEAHHHLRRPARAEVVATRDALKFIEKYQLKGKLCHYSSGEGLELIREARRKGLEVKIEVTPQHLYYSIEELNEKDYTKFQMNPPLRYHTDKEILLKAFKAGEIDFLATDHAPHTDDEKTKGISGLTGLDTYAGFVTWLIGQGVSLEQIALSSAENPGRFFNQFLESFKSLHPSFHQLGKGFGFVEKNYTANFTILNLKRPLTITKDFLKTKVKHSPFEGVTFPGSLESVFIQGKK